MPYQRQGVPTETPQARAEVTAAIESWWAAQLALEASRAERDAVLRKHYAAGVDPRDLHRIATDAGWTVHLNHLKRIAKGARLESA